MQHIQVLTKYWVIWISSNVVLQPCISGPLNWINFIIISGCVQILAHWISIQNTQRLTFYAWLFLKSYVSETLFLLLLALGYFLLCFLHHELSSTSFCSLQHWHNALKSVGSYGTLMENISCALWINYFPIDGRTCWSSYRRKFCVAVQIHPDGSVLCLE